jgi:hypothetical protein
MAARRVVEPLDVVEHVTRAWVLVRYTFLDVFSVFNELKKLSIAELSQTSPARLMLQVMPCSLQQCLEVLAGVLAALVRVMQQLHGLASAPHGHHQCVGHKLRGHAVMHRPAHARREYRSSTAAAYSQPSAVQM